MAHALECPACGARHRLDTLPEAPTFRCDRCGQVLKVPTPVSTGGRGPRTAAAVRSAAAPGPAAAAARSGHPERPRRCRDTRRAGAPRRGVGDGRPPGPAEDATATRRRGDAARSRPGPSPRLVVLADPRVDRGRPVGFVITAWPASSSASSTRTMCSTCSWAPAAAATCASLRDHVWALVTALLVQLLVEGGRVARPAPGAREAVPA